jgi:hypothetical protein
MIFDYLFESERFMPHGQCFIWTPSVLWLHAISDAIIAISYFSIPCIIFYILYRQQNIPFRWIYLMLAAFIVLCGATHVLGIIVLWYPIYRFEGLIKAMTAGVSIATALLAVPLVPKFLAVLDKMPTDLVALSHEKTNKQPPYAE